jgi:uncharacterized protein YndB with AHSA1/START domain
MGLLVQRNGDAMPQPSDRAPIDRELETTAAPDAVWEALTDPERLGDWLEADVELEVRPGGAGRFSFADGEERRAMVETVRPGTELTFSWWRSDDTGLATDPATTTVTFRIEATPAGGTILRLREAAAVHVRAQARALAGVVA